MKARVERRRKLLRRLEQIESAITKEKLTAYEAKRASLELKAKLHERATECKRAVAKYPSLGILQHSNR